ncbi:NOL8-like protein [Mya arenaria]|uniref:NOL8-like protein n=1 Tax=Mya arenaria TaxID=6604 RepID=A0ABY7E2B1_MYAAR|nr:NOL8-like protein [Mya arenaria]
MTDSKDIEKRLHIAGLYAGVEEGELKERFSKFGTVSDIVIKVRKDVDGFNTYSKTKWKGSELKLQVAKDNFIDRLEQERRQQAETGVDSLEERVEKKPAVPAPGPEKFQMKGAPPGTAVPGEKDWIVGKYGRVLPVVHLKKSGYKKIMKVDPSKLTHNLKKLTDDCDMGGLKVSSLTWEMEDSASEITRKRKGEFPEVHGEKKKKDVNQSDLQKRIEEVLSHDKQVAKERKEMEDDLEIVPVANSISKAPVKSSETDQGSSKDNLAKFDSDSESEMEAESFENTKQKISLENPRDHSKRKVILEVDGKQSDGKNSTLCKSQSVKCTATKVQFESESSESNEDDACKTLHSEKNATKQPAGTTPQKRNDLPSKSIGDSVKKILVDDGSSESSISSSDSSIGEENVNASLDKVHRKTVPKAVAHTKTIDPESDEESDSSSSDEDIVVSNATNTKKLQLEEKCQPSTDNVNGANEEKKKDEIHAIDKTDKSVAGDGERKRLEALKQRKLETQDQKTTIQRALASIDSGKMPNKKIVFDSDDSSEDEQEEMDQEEVDDGLHHQGKEMVKPTRSSQLFEGSDEEGSDSDLEEDRARFNIKQQFEGATGKKLATLQSRYANDERFRLDARFAESGSEDDGDEAVSGDIADEKKRSIHILQSVVGASTVKAMAKMDKARVKFKDVGSLKYDPSKEDHRQFEVEVDVPDEEQSEPSDIIMPEVSKEKFYEVSDTLRNTFTSRTPGQGGEGFSLLAAFGQQHSDDDEDRQGHDFHADGEAVVIPDVLRSDQLSLDSRFKVVEEEVKVTPEVGEGSSSEESGGEDGESSSDEAPDNETAMDVNESIGKPASKPSTFFFIPNDPRLIDGSRFTQKDDLDVMREKWLKKRAQLVESYKTKHKNFRRKHQDTGSQSIRGRHKGRRGRK